MPLAPFSARAGDSLNTSLANAGTVATSTAGAVVNSLTSNECATTGGATSGINCGLITATVAQGGKFDGARSDPGAAGNPIDVWNRCRWVDNVSSSSSWVPFKHANEWMAFTTNAPTSIFHLAYCARPYTPSIAPGSNCGTPVLKTPAAQLGYARVSSDPSAAVVETVQYTCTNTGNGCTTPTQWVETVTATYLPSQPSTDDLAANATGWVSGWNLASAVAYDDSQKPADCVASTCGSANGTAVTSAPTTNLCTTGTASAVTGSGPWSWTCTSSSGGTPASCSASVNQSCVETLYVTNNGGNDVYLFDSNGNYLSQFGSPGSGNGQFNYPDAGINIDASGNLLVSDGGNHRVQKFDRNGNYISQFGSTIFSLPIGITLDANGDIFVANDDPTGGEVQVFDANGGYIGHFGDGQFKAIESVAMDRNGNIWATDRKNNRVQEYTANGVFLKQIGCASGPCPASSASGGFSLPWDIKVDTDGNLLVVDHGNNRVQKFDTNGNYLSQFGSSGSGNGQFNTPIGIAVDASGNIFVADTKNYRVQVFDRNGNYLRQFAGFGTVSGSSPDGFTGGPRGIVIGYSGSCAPTTPPAAHVDGACGSANGMAAASAPAADLCNSGVASNVGGSGPWTWTCAGSNGGTTASCATANVSTCSIAGQPSFMAFGMYICNGCSCDDTVKGGPNGMSGSPGSGTLATFWLAPDCTSSNTISNPPGFCVTQRQAYDARQIGCGGDYCLYCSVSIKSCTGPIGGGGKSPPHINYL